MSYAMIRTDWGFAAIVYSDRGLCGLVLPESSEDAVRRRVRRDRPEAVHDPSIAPSLQRRIRDYFAGRPVAFDCPVDLRAMTPFQRRVLRACRRLRYGEVTTYASLARRVGRPRAARAIGAALARNPVPLVVPCHRVVSVGGGLCGFSAPGGVDMKRRMLEHEAMVARTNGKAAGRKGARAARHRA
ncbi:MAG: methylated-DNA--[protein]-cysteine S-methyltransferase [Phycisphaerae bacterium]